MTLSRAIATLPLTKHDAAILQYIHDRSNISEEFFYTLVMRHNPSPDPFHVPLS